MTPDDEREFWIAVRRGLIGAAKVIERSMRELAVTYEPLSAERRDDADRSDWLTWWQEYKSEQDDDDTSPKP